VIIVLYFKSYIQILFESINNVAIALIFTGFVLITTLFIERKDYKISFKMAFFIGLAQSIAIVPGISRSGMTISTAMLLGLSSKNAAKFSFMLAIPAISGAGILTIIDFNGGFSLPYEIILSSLFSSFIVGVFSLKLLLNLLSVGKFHFFGLYCLVVGFITLIK
jgi:undecaprenyl-diphosphatase